MEKLYTLLKSTLTLFLLFTTLSLQAADYYWVGGAGTWSDLNHWATTSGGSTLHTTLPGETDDVFLDANSFTADNQQLAIDQYARFHDFTANNLGFSIELTGGGDWYVFGSVDVSNEVTLNLTSTISFTFNNNETVFIAQDNFNAGNPKGVNITFSGSGQLSLNSGLAASTLYHNSGEVIYGAHTFDVTYFYASYSSDRTIDISDATINVGRWSVNENANINLISTNSTINVNDEFHGAGKQYNALVVSMPDSFNDVIIEGDNTFSSVELNAGIEVELAAGSEQTITSSLTVNGTSSDVVEFLSSAEGNAATITGSGINISGDYVNITDVDFTGTATFALQNSLVLDDSQGWEINSVPTPDGNGQFYFSRIYSDSVYLGLTAGNGQERIVFMRKGTYPDVTVADDTEYAANSTFGQGDLVGTDTYVIYQGNEKQVKIDGLEPNTEYYIARMEVNSNTDGTSIKYQNTSTGFAKSAITLETGNIYMHNGSVSVNTGDTFYDDGGSGYYFPNREQVLTLNSAEAGKSVMLTFSELDLRTYEELKIFDGPDATTPLLESFSGSSHSLPLTVTSSGESLTVKFESDDFETSGFSSEGWKAEVDLKLEAPSTASSNGNVTALDDNKISFEFTPGNGSGRIILAAEESTNFNYSLTDDVTYTANNTFTSGEEIATGVYVVENGNISQLDLNGLSENSTYNIRVIEYNEAGGSIKYASNHYEFQVSNSYQPPSDDFIDYRISKNSYPIVQRAINSISLARVYLHPYAAISDGTLNALVLASESPIEEDDLTSVLVDDFRVESNTSFGQGDEVLPGVFAISKGKFDSDLLVNNLDPDTKYYFSAILFRENIDGVRYGTSTFTQLLDVSTIPQGSIMLGDGQNSISEQKAIYDHTGISGNFPDVFSYTETYYPSKNDEILKLVIDYTYSINNIEFIIYDGEDTNAPILKDYSENRNGAFSNQEVLTATNSAGAITIKYAKDQLGQGSSSKTEGFKGVIFPYKEAVAPTMSSSNIQVTNVTYQSADISWERGNGAKSLIILSADKNNIYKPIDGLDYEARPDLTEEVSPNNFIVYNGSDNNVSLNNVKAGVDYRISIYEYNKTSTMTAYEKTGVQTTFATKSNTPQVEASNFDFEVLGEDEVKLKWKNGDGQKRLVVVSNNYLSLSDDFFYNKNYEGVNGGDYNELPNYSDINNEDFVLAYNGTGNSVTISGLSQNTVFRYAVIEYNELNGITNYHVPQVQKRLDALPVSPSHTTTSAEIYDLTASSVGLHSTPDENSLIVISENSDVDVPFNPGKIPNQLLDIGWSGDYQQTNFQGFINDKLVSLQNLDSITIGGLKPNTEYTIAVYPANYSRTTVNFNESNPVIKTFTTTDTKDYYYVNQTGIWDDKENWVTSSGGKTLHHSIPDENSNVIIDENSFVEENENTDRITFNDYDYAMYSLDMSKITKEVRLVNKDYITLSFTIGTNINTNGFADNANNYTFLQLADSNFINFGNDRNLFSISFSTNNGNKTYIKSLPYIGYFEASNSRLIFDVEEDVLDVTSIYTNSTSVENMPTFIRVRSIESDLHFPKIISNDEFLVQSSLRVDSLELQTQNLKLSGSDTLFVSSLQYPEESFVISTAAGTSFIKTDQDSLIIENAIVSDNHAIGNAVYLAKNSIAIDNVKGWNFSLDSVPALTSKGDMFGFKVLKNSFTITNKNEPQFQYNFVSIRKIGDTAIAPSVRNIPTVSSEYNSELGKEQGVYVGDDERFDINGLEAGTQYELKLYDFFQGNDSIIYAEPNVFKLTTLNESDIVMSSERREVSVTKNIMYTENGGGSSYPWNENIITLLPTNPEKFVSITSKPESGLSSPLILNIYDGIDSSAPIIFSESMRDYDIMRNTIEANSYTATNPQGALTVELKRPEGSYGGSIYGGPTAFLVYESKGLLADEPTQQASNIQFTDVTQNKAEISWTKGDGNKTLLVVSEGGISYGPHIFKDGVHWEANSRFGLGDMIGDMYVVYSGEGTSMTLESLEPEKGYSIIAISFNDSATEDPNYLTSDLDSDYFYTVPEAPNNTPSSFVTYDKQSNATNFSFEDLEGDGALILIKEASAVDLDLVADSVKAISKSNYETNFENLDSLSDGSKIYFNYSYSGMEYFINGLSESTNYHYAIFNFNANARHKTLNETALTGSFRTRDASYKIDNFALQGQALQRDTICQSAEFQIQFSYLGVNEGENSPIVVYSSTSNLKDSVVLDILSSEGNYLNVQLPKGVESGKYYFSLIPEFGSDYTVYIDSLNVVSFSEVEITLTENGLTSNYEQGNQWLFNGEPIVGATSQSIAIDRTGVYSVEVSTEYCSVVSEGVSLTSNRKGLLAVGFRVYPNPISEELNLKYKGDEFLGLSSVVITDVTGKAIYNGLHDFQKDRKLEIPLMEISSGIYFITVETKNYRAQQKLIKK